MFYLSADALAGVALLGFLAGLLSCKVKSRWCPVCGETLGCVSCRDQARIRRTER